MRQRFDVPHEFAAPWGLLVSRYREYLPEIRMERHSFVALPEEAAAIFRQLEEMALFYQSEDKLSRRASR
jgi:hypothetical protein